MTWDRRDEVAVMCARLKVSPAEFVYQTLKDRGDWIDKNRFRLSNGNELLDKTLLDRNDPLVDLALAQFTTNPSIVAGLYGRSHAGKMGKEYALGLRVACLSNKFVGSGFFFSDAGEWLGEPGLIKLIRDGDEEEIYALVQNPNAGALLASLYGRRNYFSDLPEMQWFALIRESIGNPRINTDYSNEDGPDLVAWDIHKEILNLLRTAPAEDGWVRMLNYLLMGLDPHFVRAPDRDIDDILDRWGNVSIKESFGEQKGEDAKGYYTDLTEVQEFCCLIAALYGKIFEDREIRVLGSTDSADVVRRCAYYGNASLSLEEMRTAIERERRTFCFAAIYNDYILDSRNRAVLESALRSDVRFLYARRCEQIHKRRPHFDPKPVSELGAELLDDVVEQPTKSGELLAVERLEKRIGDLNDKFSRLQTMASWGLIAVLVILFWIR